MVAKAFFDELSTKTVNLLNLAIAFANLTDDDFGAQSDKPLFEKEAGGVIGLTPFTALCSLVCVVESGGAKENACRLAKFAIDKSRPEHINKPDSEGFLPIDWAVRTKDLGLITACHGCIPEAQVSPAIWHGMVANLEPEVVKHMLDLHIADPNVPNLDGKTAFSALANYAFMTKNGAFNGLPEMAVNLPRLPLVDEIATSIANSDLFDPQSTYRDAFGATPVRLALEFPNYPELLPKILAKGARIDDLDVHGRTALDIKAAAAAPLPVLALLNNGANVNATGPDGRTPVHSLFLKPDGDTCYVGALEDTLKVLLNHDNRPPFNPSLTTNDGRMATDILKAKIAGVQCLRSDCGDTSSPFLDQLQACLGDLESYGNWYAQEGHLFSGQHVPPPGIHESGSSPDVI